MNLDKQKLLYGLIAIIVLALVFQIFFRYEYLVMPGHAGYATGSTDTNPDEPGDPGTVVRVDRLTGHTCIAFPPPPSGYACPAIW